jgi:hypothetical protein
LNQWLLTDESRRYQSNLAWEDGELIGASMSAELIDFDNASESVQAMNDMRDITDDYGPGDSFPYNSSFG